MKKPDCYRLAVVDLFYEMGNFSSLEEIAKHYAVSLEDCQSEWQSIAMISQSCEQSEEAEPSQLSVNKILAYSREEAQKRRNRFSFWAWLKQPASAALVVMFVGLMSFQAWQVSQTPEQLAVVNDFNPPVVQGNALQKRLMATSLDQREFFRSIPSNTIRHPGQLATTVSTSSQQLNFGMDDFFVEAGDGVNIETDALFYRARRLQKQGYIKQALDDYLLLSQSQPDFAKERGLVFAVARCYELLGEREKAVAALENARSAFPRQEQQINAWIEQLKSETF